MSLSLQWYHTGRIIHNLSLHHSRIEQVDEDGPQEQEDGRHGQRLLQLYRRGPEGAAADFRRLARCPKGESSSSIPFFVPPATDNWLIASVCYDIVIILYYFIRSVRCQFVFLSRYWPEGAAAATSTVPMLEKAGQIRPPRVVLLLKNVAVIHLGLVTGSLLIVFATKPRATNPFLRLSIISA